MSYDIVIVGGGPAGLSAALALGRARKRVLVCDAGPRRNATAKALHNFVTRDGIPPDEFRRVAREQLAQYTSVEVRDVGAEVITDSRGAFTVKLSPGEVTARRILLTTGMVDQPLALDGYARFWGHEIIQCPYCHGWEARDRPWGVLVSEQTLPHLLPFALQLRGWSQEVTVFTNGLELPADLRRTLEQARLRVETARVARFTGAAHLEAVELLNGERVKCELLFSHPPQRQVDVVAKLGLELDEHGFVKVDPLRRETSRPGVYAAGDLTTAMQGAVLAAAAGTVAAAMLNVELSMELASP